MGSREARKAGLKREKNEYDRENEVNGTEPERGRGGEAVPSLWSFQSLDPVP